jgi:CIC family chloride channel protein
MLHLSAVREVLFDQDLRRVTLVGTVMDADVARVPIDASVLDALEIFERTGAWVLPAVDGERFVGLLSKSTLFDHYRRELSVQAGGTRG